jgi:hypothetical protein
MLPKSCPHRYIGQTKGDSKPCIHTSSQKSEDYPQQTIRLEKNSTDSARQEYIEKKS